MSEQTIHQSLSQNHFSDSEVATILAALKLFQEHTKNMISTDILEAFPDFFDEEELPPLSKYDLAFLWSKIDEGGLCCGF